jgi:hypothetical protein
MTNAIDKYLSLLWEIFQYDINILSRPWMYYWVLIPAIGYLVFFFIKWAVITTPLWLPVALALSSFKGRRT